MGQDAVVYALDQLLQDPNFRANLLVSYRLQRLQQQDKAAKDQQAAQDLLAHDQTYQDQPSDAPSFDFFGADEQDQQDQDELEPSIDFHNLDGFSLQRLAQAIAANDLDLTIGQVFGLSRYYNIVPEAKVLSVPTYTLDLVSGGAISARNLRVLKLDSPEQAQLKGQLELTRFYEQTELFESNFFLSEEEVSYWRNEQFGQKLQLQQLVKQVDQQLLLQAAGSKLAQNFDQLKQRLEVDFNQSFRQSLIPQELSEEDDSWNAPVKLYASNQVELGLQLKLYFDLLNERLHYWKQRATWTHLTAAKVPT